MDVEISYCVVNNDGREYLLACLEAIERNYPPGLATEVLTGQGILGQIGLG